VVPRPAFLRVLWPLVAALGLALPAAALARPADFQGLAPSAEARDVADWVVDSGDHAGLPFVIVDKVQSRVFVFDGQGRLQGAAPALVGLAQGDESVPGIGQRPMAGIRPEERTTPAGRFVASLERSLQGEEILWVDYDAGIALHPVAVVAKERRLQRLASIVTSDHRITYGCINVPVAFFHGVVAPLFRASPGVVYVLPEGRTARDLFGSYDVAPAASGSGAASHR
jgi:hypothetical protein